MKNRYIDLARKTHKAHSITLLVLMDPGYINSGGKMKETKSKQDNQFKPNKLASSAFQDQVSRNGKILHNNCPSPTKIIPVAFSQPLEGASSTPSRKRNNTTSLL